MKDEARGRIKRGRHFALAVFSASLLGLASPVPQAASAPDVRLAQATEAFQSACRELESVGDDGWKAKTLQSIASLQAKAGDVTDSQQNFAKALQKGDHLKAGALYGILTEQFNAGNATGAEASVASLSPGLLKCKGYIDLAEALLEEMHPSEGEEP